MNDLFESKPRWPGAPKICVFENLPAFEDDRALKAFNETCGDHGVLLKWRCTSCGCLHFYADPPAPAGGSSGTKRVYVHPVPRSAREFQRNF